MVDAQAQYNIGGMSCSFCAETINKAYGRTEGVEDVDVSLAHEEVLVQYDDNEIDEIELKDTLRDLGYTIRDPDKEKRFEEQQDELRQGKRRLWISGIASIISLVMMGVMVARNGWTIFAETDAQWMWYGSLAFALVTMFWPGLYIKQKAWSSLKRGIFNQHVLLEAGAFAGLAGGLLGWFVFADFPVVHFFVVSTFITTYHILSEYTSLIVRTRASRAVNDLMDLQPDTARRVTEEGVEEVPVDELAVGDRVRVTPGENLPIDGEVIDGESAVDESVATGESSPIDKRPGDDVIGGSVNETGTLLVEVTATGEDAFLNQVAHQIKEARAMKPGIVQLADTVLKYFVPGVLTVATAAFLFWVIVPTVVPGVAVGSEPLGLFGREIVLPRIALGSGPQYQTGAFAALAALVLGYPCALGMATPLALIRGGGEAAKRGILMRSGDAFQVFQDVDRIVLDKTGTITEGEPAVDTVVGSDTYTDTEVLRTAASAETFSEHPLAAAILDAAEAQDISVPDPEAFDSVTGKGVTATVDGEDVLVGKPGWLAAEGVDLSVAADAIEQLQAQGLTTVGVVVNDALVGLIGIGDEIKDDARQTIDRMTEAGVTPIMITGDNERTAQTVAEAVGIERVMAEVLPDDKRREIQTLQDAGHRVGMVGDGINDAPALTQADIGIAIGAGTDIAIESADIVLMGDRLGGVMDAYEIGQTSYTKTKQNLIAAFSFNGLGVTGATTGLVHPVFAMLAMITSVTAVLANSFAGQLLSGEGIKTDFIVESEAAADTGGTETADADTELTETAPELGIEHETQPTPMTETDSEASTADERPARETTTFSVDLTCEGCEQRVTETVLEHDGVREVDADADEKCVAVTFTPHATSSATIRDSIADLGYDIDVESGADENPPSGERVTSDGGSTDEHRDTTIHIDHDRTAAVNPDTGTQHVTVTVDSDGTSADAEIQEVVIAVRPDGTSADGSHEPATSLDDAVDSDSATDDETPTYERTTFGVDIHCDGCEKRITESLMDDDGVVKVDADAETQRVGMTFDPDTTSVDDLQATITDLGYEVDADLAIDPETASTTSTHEMVTFDVDLHCEGCEKRVIESLLDQDGVTEVDADADTQRVDVTISPAVTSVDEPREGIAALGYEVERAQPVTED